MPEHQGFQKSGILLNYAKPDRARALLEAEMQRLLHNDDVRGNAQFFLNISFVLCCPDDKLSFETLTRLGRFSCLVRRPSHRCH